MKQDTAQDLARRLRRAATGHPPAGPEEAGRPGDLDEAYAVQDAARTLAVEAGDQVIGYKIALTSQPARDTFGAEEPAAGFLLAGRRLAPGRPLVSAGLYAPKAEVEIAFVLGAPLPGPYVTRHDVHRATAAVAPAFEIADSRWRGGASTLPMLVADNANAAWIAIGDTVAPPSPDALTGITATLSSGAATRTGSATAVLGDPAEAVAWLANHLLRRGTRLEAGDIILSGTLCTPVAVAATDRLVADLGVLGRIGLDVVATEPTGPRSRFR